MRIAIILLWHLLLTQKPGHCLPLKIVIGIYCAILWSEGYLAAILGDPEVTAKLYCNSNVVPIYTVPTDYCQLIGCHVKSTQRQVFDTDALAKVNFDTDTLAKVNFDTDTLAKVNFDTDTLAKVNFFSFSWCKSQLAGVCWNDTI